MAFTSRSSAMLRQLATKRASAQSARFASSSAAGQQASSADIASKAQQGLARAGSSLVKAGNAAGAALGKVGGRTGKVIALVQSMIPHAVYYSRVALELGKLVAANRQMAPPSAASFQNYVRHFFTNLNNPAASTSVSSILSSIRNTNKQQLAAAGVVAAEVIGFFSVGEILGRMKLVGYRSTEHGAGH